MAVFFLRAPAAQQLFQWLGETDEGNEEAGNGDGGKHEYARGC